MKYDLCLPIFHANTVCAMCIKKATHDTLMRSQKIFKRYSLESEWETTLGLQNLE